MSRHPDAGEHELLSLVRVRRKLDHIQGTMDVSTGGTLVTALDKLSCAPSITMTLRVRSSPLNCIGSMSIAGSHAGDFINPNVPVILDNSSFSSFGKGDKTVVDPAYRTGREIPAANIRFSSGRDDYHDEYGYKIKTVEHEVGDIMFIGRNVSLKLHKLAIYEPGGHFDWHMDSTHNDAHHGTVLIALNTSWKGGDLVLRRNGIERRVDMHTSVEDKYIRIQAVGFYTDTEHKVEPVTEGVRIVLQYDVEVAGWSEPPTGDEMEVEPPEEVYLADNTWRQRQDARVEAKVVLADATLIENVVQIIETSLDPKFKKSHREVAFGLQHLYRRASILPIYLKGADAQLYKALTDRGLDVSLSPMVLHGVTDYDGSLGSFKAQCYDYDPNDPHSSDSDSSDEDDTSNSNNPSGDKADCFHLPQGSAIVLIHSENYVEYTGNEAQLGETKYFGSGMFVRKKEAAKSG
jgi:hypothetical protein